MLWGRNCVFLDDVYAYGLQTVRVKRSFLATHVTHAQTCNVTRVLSANGMDCFGTYFTHVQTCNVTRVLSANGMDCFGTYFTHVQTCNVTRVLSATEWTASVHTLHMFFFLERQFAVHGRSAGLNLCYFRYSA